MKYHISVPCCTKLLVTLSGKAKEHRSVYAGIYILQPEDINGYMYWKHVNGTKSIWHDYDADFEDDDGYWRIGVTENIGDLACEILSETQETCPHVTSPWKYYYNESWHKDDDQNYVKIVECTEEMVHDIEKEEMEMKKHRLSKFDVQRYIFTYSKAKVNDIRKKSANS